MIRVGAVLWFVAETFPLGFFDYQVSVKVAPII